MLGLMLGVARKRAWAGMKNRHAHACVIARALKKATILETLCRIK